MVEGLTEKEFNEWIKHGENPMMYHKFESYEGEPLWYHKERHKYHYDYVKKAVQG